MSDRPEIPEGRSGLNGRIMDNVENMTKVLAGRLANHVYGYIKGGPDTYEGSTVCCPACQEYIPLTYRPYPRCNQPFSRAEIRDTVIEHLTHSDTDVRCPRVKSVRPGSTWAN
jgi:hypothetical protein